jgi:hypothetical protein
MTRLCNGVVVFYGFKKRDGEFCRGGRTRGVQVAKKRHPSCGKHMRPSRTWTGLSERGTG